MQEMRTCEILKSLTGEKIHFGKTVRTVGSSETFEFVIKFKLLQIYKCNS